MRMIWHILALAGILITIGLLASLGGKPENDVAEEGGIHDTSSSLKTCYSGNGRGTRRGHVASIRDFGGVGDGATLNTEAFQRAVFHLASLARSDGLGSQLTVPPGTWLTGCFNLTSHFTLYLQKGATILASQNIVDWPLVSPLPSYGRGRERPGLRHCSLIHGDNLVDVIITGDNGTIDGQGSVWWEMWEKRTLEHTRGHLIEFIGSQDVVITNVVLRNSPFWTVHPIYCNNVVVKGVTILAPATAPNTDGVDPDSSTNVCIEDCYISNGDDLIAVKSGWDEYGITVGRASANIVIRRVTGTTPCCSGIALGSEVSGGVANMSIEDVHVFNSSAGVRLKTAPGRGAFITNISIAGMRLDNVASAFRFSVDSAEHPDRNYNPNAFTTIRSVSIRDVTGTGITQAGIFTGSKNSPLLDLCLSGISLNITPSRRNPWTCSPYVHGSSSSIFPPPCSELRNQDTSATCRQVNAQEENQ